jgi:hypothetical protein
MTIPPPSIAKVGRAEFHARELVAAARDHKTDPLRMNATAVAGAILGKPGTMLLTTTLSSAHPARTVAPAAETAIPVARANRRGTRDEIADRSIIRSRPICSLPFRSRGCVDSLDVRWAQNDDPPDQIIPNTEVSP